MPSKRTARPAARSSRARSRAGRGSDHGTGTAGRIVGIDVARGLALLGMMATHIVPLTEGDASGTEQASWAALLFAGKASALFAILAGVGLALLSGGRAPHHGPRLAADRRSVALRAVLIAGIGLACGSLDTNVAIILAQYGVLFLLATAFIGLRPRTLWWLASGWLLLSPVAYFLVLPWVSTHVSPAAVQGSPDFLDLLRPATLVADLLVTGTYPVLVWTGFILLGLALGRCRVSHPPVALACAVGGAAIAWGARSLSDALVFGNAEAVRLLGGLSTANGLPLPAALESGRGLAGTESSPWWFALSAPHSTAPLDLLHVSGTAVAVLGICQLFSMALTALLGEAGEALLWPVSGAGSATLTLYTAHLVALDLLSTVTAAMPRAQVYVWFVVGALLVGIALKWAHRRGPLEGLAHAVARSRSA